MGKLIDLPPDPHLLESMRAVGYTAETAVADLIDNSIAASAHTVHVLTSAEGPLRLAIFDDGSGMDRDTALNAMRLAARSPSETRSSGDLGRFGLGLKTASLSQCRTLTVATRRDGVTTVLRWSLDHVSKSGSWSVIEVDPDEGASLLGWSLLQEVSRGTLVTWEDMDLFRMTEGEGQAEFDEAMVRVRNHCELVFHRFTSGDGVPKVSITFNGNAIEALDPFLRSSRATQSRQETLRVAGEALQVRAFTLPFINKMTAAQKRRALAAGSLRDSQGFYIYRSGRLVIWGTWFRLNPKSEMGKLARVQVDVPNTLDHLWALDIKKSQATPPREMKDALRKLATQMIAPSERVQKYRGRKVRVDDSITRMWQLVSERDNEFRYAVNREHPLAQRLAESLNQDQLNHFQELLDVVEQSFPVVDAHNRLSEDGISTQEGADADELIDRAQRLRTLFEDTHPDDEDFLGVLLGMEPYATSPGFANRFRHALNSKR